MAIYASKQYFLSRPITYRHERPIPDILLGSDQAQCLQSPESSHFASHSRVTPIRRPVRISNNIFHVNRNIRLKKIFPRIFICSVFFTVNGCLYINYYNSGACCSLVLDKKGTGDGRLLIRIAGPYYNEHGRKLLIAVRKKIYILHALTRLKQKSFDCSGSSPVEATII